MKRSSRRGVVDPRGARLDQEALGEIPGPDAHGIERLEKLEREGRLGLRARDRRADLRKRHAEVAVRVDVPDHEGARLPHDRVRLRDSELLGEMRVETGRGLGPVLQGELLPFLAHPRGGRRGPSR